MSGVSKCARQLLCAGCGLRDIDLRPSAAVLVDGAQTSIFTMKIDHFWSIPAQVARQVARPTCSPRCSSRAALTSCLQLPPAAFLLPPGELSQDSPAKIPQARLPSQDSSANIPQPKIPQPGFLSQDSSAKIPDPRFPSQVPRPDKSAWRVAIRNIIKKLFGVTRWSHIAT